MNSRMTYLKSFENEKGKKAPFFYLTICKSRESFQKLKIEECVHTSEKGKACVLWQEVKS